MSFILANNTKYSFEKVEALNISKNQGNSLMEIQFWELNLNTNSLENSWDDLDVEQAICIGLL